MISWYNALVCLEEIQRGLSPDMILSAVWCGVLFLLMPIILGYGVSCIVNRGEDKGFSVAKSYVSGYLFLWTLIELLAIPVTIFKASFNLLVGVVSVICAAVMVVAVIFAVTTLFLKRLKSEEKLISKYFRCIFKDKWDVTFFVIVIILFGIILYKHLGTYFFDEDDSRFIVNAVDIVRTRRILAVDPTTGLPLASNYDDFHKDLVGQWAAFIAYCSVISGVHPTIFAHTFYPVVAFTMLGMLYWLLLGRRSTTDKSLTLMVIMALYIYGYYSLRNAETFTMIRVWQGKGTLAAVGVLSIIWSFTLIYKKPEEKYGYIVLLLANVSACLMTSNGIILAVLVIGGYGLVYAIMTKKVRVLLISMAICVPNVLLYVLSSIYTLDKYLG